MPIILKDTWVVPAICEHTWLVSIIWADTVRCRGGWLGYVPFSAHPVSVRSAVSDGGGMDHFLAFCHSYICHSGWQSNAPFSVHSVTVWSAVCAI